jgi:hypothetical protein
VVVRSPSERRKRERQENPPEFTNSALLVGCWHAQKLQNWAWRLLATYTPFSSTSLLRALIRCDPRRLIDPWRSFRDSNKMIASLELVKLLRGKEETMALQL